MMLEYVVVRGDVRTSDGQTTAKRSLSLSFFYLSFTTTTPHVPVQILVVVAAKGKHANYLPWSLIN
jgi:hypothetical protein